MRATVQISVSMARSSAMRASWITWAGVVPVAPSLVCFAYIPSQPTGVLVLTYLLDIRNPICLAKTLLDKSLEPLSLRRVPPSFLVGQGAVKFARHHGFEVLPNENLISKNAGDRFHRWQNELRRVATDPASPPKSRKPTSVDSSAARAESASSVDTYHSGDRATMVSGFYNEAQSGFPSKDFGVLEGASYSQDGPPRQGIQGPGPSRQSTQFDTPDLGILDEIQLPRMPASTYEDKSLGRDLQQRRSRYTWSKSKPSEGDGADGTTLGDGPSSPSISNQVSPRNVQSSRETPTRTSVSPTLESAPTRHKRSFGEYAEQAKDSISDTVGAIAIDSMGRIAAGSSSGGIGMKHRGRVGPAALVRVGSAVIPAHPKDPLDVSVAAVASGTGEHIATTMASQRCAERLIRGSRQGEFGEDLYDGDDHDILHAFIQEDFMKHPGVQGMTTTGALGIIAVKMSKTAYYFYFGHNTESFALATMGSTDREPQCLMSRLNPDGDTKISVGARRIRRQ